VLLVAAHQCNWEWMLLALPLELGYPLDAAYNAVDNWAEREMKKVRTRFAAAGAAQTCCRTSSSAAAWCARWRWSPTRSPPAASKSTGPGFSIATRRSTWSRGNRARHALSGVLHRHAPHCARLLRNAVRAARHGGAVPPAARYRAYARRVEEQIRSAPSDWPWSHKRWKLKKSLYQNRGSAEA